MSLGGELRVLLPLLLLLLLVVASESLFLLFIVFDALVLEALIAVAARSFLPSSFKLPSPLGSVVVVIGLELLLPQLNNLPSLAVLLRRRCC